MQAPGYGPNHTGNNNQQNPTPGGNSTETPGEGPRGVANTGGNQIGSGNPADASGTGYGGGKQPNIDPITLAVPESNREAIVYERPSSLVQDRVDSLTAQIPQNSQGRITMGVAVLENSNGERFVVVSTSEPCGYLRPSVTIRPGEIVISGNGHAEADIVSYANANGFRIIEVGATRPVCANCQNTLAPTGANVVTPLKPPAKGNP